ncbi:hypothetical protein BDP67DRAFT_486850 [Colletotrichum lupini]|nr:hypothetical protein BDP67DRAFT_486850 [Colletotrichum lupini]
MESLPVEVLQMTLSYLCMHCRDPTGFPHADTQEVRDDKRALAFLCRISRRISAVAYPILYHYYATGNMHLRQTVITRQRPIRNTPEPNLVQKFTRTIRQRPDLASYVDAMQVASWDLEINYRLTSPDSSSSDSSVSDSEVPPEVWEAASTLYAEHSRKPQPPTPIKDYSMLEGEIPDLIAAIQSCPRLQSLLVSYSDHDPIWPEKSWLGLRMPSIRRLGVIVGLSRQCTLYINFAGMQNMFPNVESIHASTGGLWILQRGTLPTKNPKDFLTKLKSLSIAGMRDPHLEELLTCLPGLERLEITNQNYDCSWRRALKPVQNRLKSLHISYHLKPHHGMKLWDVKFRHSERFRLCGALEELSLDCRDTEVPSRRGTHPLPASQAHPHWGERMRVAREREHGCGNGGTDAPALRGGGHRFVVDAGSGLGTEETWKVPGVGDKFDGRHTPSGEPEKGGKLQRERPRGCGTCVSAWQIWEIMCNVPRLAKFTSGGRRGLRTRGNHFWVRGPPHH